MAIAFVQSNTAEATSIALTGVGAGNLIVLWIKWENALGDCTATDGTTSLTMGTSVSDAAGTSGQFAYLLSANGGNKTYTVTFPVGAGFQRLRIFEYSYTGTVSFDAQNTGSGVSAAPASGNITTTGTDEVVVGGYSEDNTNTVSAQKINAVAADRVIGGATIAQEWDRILTATFAGGNAQATLSASQGWVCNIIAFKVAAAAAVDRGIHLVEPVGRGMIVPNLRR